MGSALLNELPQKAGPNFVLELEKRCDLRLLRVQQSTLGVVGGGGVPEMYTMAQMWWLDARPHPTCGAHIKSQGSYKSGSQVSPLFWSFQGECEILLCMRSFGPLGKMCSLISDKYLFFV